MSKVKDDGGPAFPRPYSNDEKGSRVIPSDHNAQEGMTLRDWLAGMALTNVDGSIASDIADRCYNFADAMIAEKRKREKPSEEEGATE